MLLVFHLQLFKQETSAFMVLLSHLLTRKITKSRPQLPQQQHCQEADLLLSVLFFILHISLFLVSIDLIQSNPVLVRLNVKLTVQECKRSYWNYVVIQSFCVFMCPRWSLPAVMLCVIGGLMEQVSASHKIHQPFFKNWKFLRNFA